MLVFKQSFKMAFRAFSANKLRFILTMLGIIIGMASVVVVYSICLGGKTMVLKQLEGLGPNLIVVFRSGGVVTDDDRDEIVKGFPEAVQNASVLYYEAEVSTGGRRKRMVVLGATPSYRDVRNVNVVSGEYFTEEDEKFSHYVCVLDEETKNAFFDKRDPVGEHIKIEGLRFRVLGVMSKKSSNLFEQMANREPTMVPLSVIQKFSGRRNTAQILFLQARDFNDVYAAPDKIKAVLSQKYQGFEGIENWTIFTLKDAIDIVNKITRILILISGSIAVISLFVGGIGIMNIMLVSVTERTREIGIRKATGARTNDILLQFLIEAGTLSFVGGTAGIFLGVIGSYFAAKIAKWQAQISVGMVLFTVIFSVAVGIFFGLYPAYKAANLQPTDALRYE